MVMLIPNMEWVNQTEIELMLNGQWYLPAEKTFGGIAEFALIVFAFATIAFVQVKTDNVVAIAFVALFFAGISAMFMPTIALKILYVVAVFALAAALYIIFGRR